MPRQARIDCPGLLHHIIARGIERKPIFTIDEDRTTFILRLKDILLKTNTPCHAWVLMPNHFHLLVTTGKYPISKVMQSLLTGYAVYFNHRYKRAGHLFQNRYKSIICDQDAYFLELVRYIHLNSLRGKIVSNIGELNAYKWCGHGVLTGRAGNDWQDIDSVLGLFGTDKRIARERYMEYVIDGIPQGRRNDLMGGGFVRGVGGWSEAVKIKKDERIMGDERILGGSDFVESILATVDDKEKKREIVQRQGWSIDKTLRYTADVLNITVKDIYSGRKQHDISEARAIACKLLLDDLGMRNIEVSRLLKISPSAVCKNVERGQLVCARMGIELEKVNK